MVCSVPITNSLSSLRAADFGGTLHTQHIVLQHEQPQGVMLGECSRIIIDQPTAPYVNDDLLTISPLSMGCCLLSS